MADPVARLIGAIAATTDNQVRFGALIGVDPRTVRRWLAGEREIPGPVLALCGVLTRFPGVARWLARQ